MIAAAPVIAAVVTLGWSGTAYAHTVNNIEVNCNSVTVTFSGFPSEGVMVHIAATVEGHGSVGTDVLVAGEMTGTLDISGETSALFGATATVHVDVTWSFEGPQHVSDSGTITCGSATTTTCPNTTTVAPTSTVVPTTTVAPTTTASTVVGGETSTTVHVGGSTSTTVAATSHHVTTTTVAAVVGSENANSGGTASAGASPSVAVEGASLSAGTGTNGSASSSGGSLPFTGSATMPLLALGLASIGAGSAAVVKARMRRTA